MVSDDSTSRVMVLPVTDDDVSDWLCAVAVKRGRAVLTGLDEDLHLE